MFLTLSCHQLTLKFGFTHVKMRIEPTFVLISWLTGDILWNSFCETLAGVMSPASNLMPEMCCMGKHLDRNDIDIVFRSTCGPKENHLNFLKFVKSLVALSLKLYPRVDASLAFSLFLAESVYGLDFIPYNVRSRAHANANELLAVHTMNSIEAYSPIGKKIKKINLGLNARNEDIFD